MLHAYCKCHTIWRHSRHTYSWLKLRHDISQMDTNLNTAVWTHFPSNIFNAHYFTFYTKGLIIKDFFYSFVDWSEHFPNHLIFYNDIKLIRLQFWCTRCAFRLLKSLQWCPGRTRGPEATSLTWVILINILPMNTCNKLLFLIAIRSPCQ
jgi:hypothetical protein